MLQHLALPTFAHMHARARLAASGETPNAAQRIGPDSPGSARCMQVKAFTIRADLDPRPAAHPTAPPASAPRDQQQCGSRQFHEVFFVTQAENGELTTAGAAVGGQADQQPGLLSHEQRLQ